MKKVIVTITFNRVRKTWTATLIIFFLVISNASFKTKSILKKCPAKKIKSQRVCILSAVDTSLAFGDLNIRVVPYVKKYIKAEGADLD